MIPQSYFSDFSVSTLLGAIIRLLKNENEIRNFNNFPFNLSFALLLPLLTAPSLYLPLKI